MENEYIGPILLGGHRFDKKFVAIKYPGNVVNPDKAVITLGGLNDISTVIHSFNVLGLYIKLIFSTGNKYYQQKARIDLQTRRCIL